MTRPKLGAEFATIDGEQFLCIFVGAQAGAIPMRDTSAFLAALTNQSDINIAIRDNGVDVSSQVILEGQTLSVASGEFDLVPSTINLTSDERQHLAHLIRRAVESLVTSTDRHQVNITVRRKDR